jgi:hypothetical protein
LTDVLTDRLEEKRQKAAKTIMNELNSIMEDLQKTTNWCDSHDKTCTALMLGTLERSAIELKLWPFLGDYPSSFKTLVQQVRLLDIQSLCGLPHSPEYSRKKPELKSHGIVESLEQRLKKIERWSVFVRGFKLKDFGAQ